MSDVIDPVQHKCISCACKTFYIMLQIDGSIECFCVDKNHRQVLVNIADLTAHIAHTIKEEYERLENTDTIIDPPPTTNS